MATETHVDNSIADPVPFVKNNVDSVLTISEPAESGGPLLLFHGRGFWISAYGLCGIQGVGQAQPNQPVLSLEVGRGASVLVIPQHVRHPQDP